MDPSVLALQPPRYVLSTFVCDRDRSEYTVEYFAYSFLSLLCMVVSGKTVCTDQSSLFFQDTSDGRFCFICSFPTITVVFFRITSCASLLRYKWIRYFVYYKIFI